jgi:hypothetical protein
MTDKRDDSLRAPEQDIDEEPPVVCRKLRTKMGFGALQGVRDWRFGDSSTAVYWCLSTMETAGPDDGYAHPHGCRAGRACYRAPDGYDDGSDLVSLGGSGERDGPRRRG